MRRIGKQGRINIQANKKLKAIYQDKGITSCEPILNGCMRNFALSWHHRKKRIEYYNCPEKLSDFDETILVCQSCHTKLEASRELTEEIFSRLRNLKNY